MIGVVFRLIRFYSSPPTDGRTEWIIAAGVASIGLEYCGWFVVDQVKWNGISGTSGKKSVHCDCMILGTGTVLLQSIE